jgi:hypothetical protein
LIAAYGNGAGAQQCSKAKQEQLMAVNDMKNTINDEILAQETKCIAKAQKIPYTP